MAGTGGERGSSLSGGFPRRAVEVDRFDSGRRFGLTRDATRRAEAICRKESAPSAAALLL